MHVELLAQGVVPRRGLGHWAQVLGVVPKERNHPTFRPRVVPRAQCQMPEDSSLLQVSVQGSSSLGWGLPDQELIVSLGSWLGSLKPSPPVTVVTNY